MTKRLESSVRRCTSVGPIVLYVHKVESLEQICLTKGLTHSLRVHAVFMWPGSQQVPVGQFRSYKMCPQKGKRYVGAATSLYQSCQLNFTKQVRKIEVFRHQFFYRWSNNGCIESKLSLLSLYIYSFHIMKTKILNIDFFLIERYS